MLFALLCHVDPSREADRHCLRAEHLQFVSVHRQRIFAGGPTLRGDGSPEMMLLLIEAVDLRDAEAFLREEPYASHGVFSGIDVRRWSRVLPEVEPGALAAALAQERHGD